MNERILKLLKTVTVDTSNMELILCMELQGKSFAPNENSPIRALDNIREALTNLRSAQIKLEAKNERTN
jgi:hypothetical protein